MILVALTLLRTTALVPTIEQFIPKFRDAAFTWRLGKADFAELKKINSDFAQSYRFKSTAVKMKEPMKLRLDATVEDTTVSFILNGTRKLIRIPRSNLNVKQNLKNDPGKRQTPLDFGILTPGLFEDLYEATFVRTDRATSDEVFDLTYADRYKDKTRQRIWVDAAKKIINKREWYSRQGNLMATFTYAVPVQDKETGIWFSSQLTVRNADNKLAGTSTFESLKLNDGIPDSLFEIK